MSSAPVGTSTFFSFFHREGQAIGQHHAARLNAHDHGVVRGKIKLRQGVRRQLFHGAPDLVGGDHLFDAGSGLHTPESASSLV
jgi:hypothetical protein